MDDSFLIMILGAVSGAMFGFLIIGVILGGWWHR